MYLYILYFFSILYIFIFISLFPSLSHTCESPLPWIIYPGLPGTSYRLLWIPGKRCMKSEKSKWLKKEKEKKSFNVTRGTCVGIINPVSLQGEVTAPHLSLGGGWHSFPSFFPSFPSSFLSFPSSSPSFFPPQYCPCNPSRIKWWDFNHWEFRILWYHSNNGDFRIIGILE